MSSTVASVQQSILERIEKLLKVDTLTFGVGSEVANLAHAHCRLVDSLR